MQAIYEFWNSMRTCLQMLERDRVQCTILYMQLYIEAIKYIIFIRVLYNLRNVITRDLTAKQLLVSVIVLH